MPSRLAAIVVCSCGWKVGDAARAQRSEEQEEVEQKVLRANVTKMYRHHQLGHRLTGRSEYRGLIEDEALKIYERERVETNEGDRR
jgi:hypothetical protein